MSLFKTDKSSIKGKTVYMVLYNYFDSDYSIIKIMENIDDAYNYICDNDEEGKHSDCKLINISSRADINKRCYKDCLNICHIPYDKYDSISLCVGYRNSVSHYAIVSMKID